MLDQEYWFAKKNKKFLQNIDTFYYTIKLANDFTSGAAADEPVKKLRRCMEKYKALAYGEKFTEVVSEFPVIYDKGCFARMYNFHLQAVGSIKESGTDEMFDVFIAPEVPASEAGLSSVTPEIMVQIRSKMLWELGVKLAFDKTLDYMQRFCDYFGLTILEVNENRTDFCWHTNALKDPETYFRPDHFTKMKVTTLGRKTTYITADNYTKKGYEVGYVALGRRQKCYLRFYLKTREIVETSKKNWFFYIWLFNGLISRYDLYVLEKAFVAGTWNHVDIARLEWVLEYDESVPEVTKKMIRETINTSAPKYEKIAKLAEQYAPEITSIINVEYQVMHRMSKSFVLLDLGRNTGVAKRVYDFFDNRVSIAKYLTHYTFRLVQPSEDDSNKSRAEYTDFWNRLRNTKIVESPVSKHDRKLVRDYSSKLNIDIRKTRTVRNLSSLSMLLNKDPETSIMQDALDMLSMLNDNDFLKIHQYKNRLYDRMSDEDKEEIIDFREMRHVYYTDEEGHLQQKEEMIDLRQLRKFRMIDEDGVILEGNAGKVSPPDVGGDPDEDS